MSYRKMGKKETRTTKEPKGTKTDYSLHISTGRRIRIEKVYLPKTVQEVIDGVVNVMLGSLTDATIVATASDVP